MLPSSCWLRSVDRISYELHFFPFVIENDYKPFSSVLLYLIVTVISNNILFSYTKAQHIYVGSQCVSLWLGLQTYFYFILCFFQLSTIDFSANIDITKVRQLKLDDVRRSYFFVSLLRAFTSAAETQKPEPETIRPRWSLWVTPRPHWIK